MRNDPEDRTVQIVTDRGDEPRETLPTSVRASLEIVEGPDAGRIELLASPQLTIGRHPACDVVLQDKAVSSQHASIFFGQSMEWRIEDLGSTNGTLLNGAQVSRYALRDADKVVVGDDLMIFHVEQA